MERNLINRNLISFWREYYDSEILQRLDLREKWEYVSKNKDMNLSQLLENRKNPLSREEEVFIQKNIVKIIDYISTFSKEEKTLLVFNLLPVFTFYLERDKLEIFKFMLKRIRDIGNVKPNERTISKVIIELTNNCNLNCIMCGVGSKKYSDKRNLDYFMYLNILETLPSSVKMIRLNGLGESTFMPDFVRYLKPLYEIEKNLELITNLNILDKKILYTLLEMEFDLYISCDSPDIQKLINIRRGLNPSIFLKNLEIIHEYKNRDSMKNQFIFTVMKNNYKDLPAMIDLAKKYNFGGIITNMVKGGKNSWKKEMFYEILDVFDYTYELAEDYGILLKLPNQIEGRPIKRNYASITNANHCKNMKDEVFIRYNGDVCPCNMMNPYIYGNLKKNSLDKIINGRIANIFYSITNTNFKHPYCKHCYFMC